MLSADVFAAFVTSYNRAVFPAQVLFYAVGLGVAAFVFLRPGKWADVAAKGGLAFLWAFVGVFNQITFYGRVNSAGYVAGAIFLLQALYYIIDIFHNQTTLKPYHHPYLGHIGAAIAGWAFIGYPITALILGRPFAGVEFFGATQLGIFTCGMVLFTFDRKPKWRFTLIPFLYACIAGVGGATQWRRYEDYAFFAAGVVLLVVWMWASNRYKEKKKK